MGWLRTALARLRGVLHRTEPESALDAELRAHLEMLTEDGIRRGLEPEDAQRQAHLSLGNTARIREAVREQAGVPWLEAIAQDMRYGLRMIRRNPGFVAVAVLSLALGIGLNTALFSIVNAVILKSLPVHKPDELVLLASEYRKARLNRGYDGAGWDDPVTGMHRATSFPYITLQRVGGHTDIFSSTFAFAPIEQLNVIVDGQAEIATGQFVSGGYYGGLGVQAWRGRVLSLADDAPGASPSAVLTWEYWQRKFAGDPRVIGSVVTIDNVPFSIVGVTPPAFVGTLQVGERADVTIPLNSEPLLHPTNSDMKKPALWWMCIMGRLQPGVTRAQAQARLEGVFQQSALEGLNAAIAAGTARATTVDPKEYPLLVVMPGGQGEMETRQNYSQPLMALMVVVGLLMLVACANVAGLLLARSAAREPEITMRLALGARRSRLVRQLLTESLLLAVLAGALGVLFAYWGKDLLAAWSLWGGGGDGTQTFAVQLDLRVLAFTTAISLLTGVLFGLAPALSACRIQLAPSLKLTHGSGHGRPRSRMGRALLVAQIAMSLVLLAASGLFVQTLHKLRTVDTGFNRDNLLLFRLSPQTNGYQREQLDDLYSRLLEQLSHLPGVQGVALTRHPLLSFSERSDNICIPGRTAENGENTLINLVSPGFFDTMQMPLLLGRDVNRQDTATSALVAVVNEVFVRKYFFDVNPIGQHFWIVLPVAKRQPGQSSQGQGIEIIGVVHDAKYTDLRRDVQPTIYQPYAQDMPGQVSFSLRYTGTEAAVLPAVRDAMRQIDPQLPLFDVRTQAQQADASVAKERMFAGLSSTVSILALLLAAIGLYGTMSHAVVRRTQEIGIRMALGARQTDVVWMVLRETLLLVATSVAVGVPVALEAGHATQKLMSKLLYGVKPDNPLTLAAAIIVLAAAALVACLVPARRASHVDPMVALRQE